MNYIKDTTGSKIYTVSESAEQDAHIAAVHTNVQELETEIYKTKYRSDRLESEVRRLSDVTSKQNADILLFKRRVYTTYIITMLLIVGYAMFYMMSL